MLIHSLCCGPVRTSASIAIGSSSIPVRTCARFCIGRLCGLGRDPANPPLVGGLDLDRKWIINGKKQIAGPGFDLARK